MMKIFIFLFFMCTCGLMSQQDSTKSSKNEITLDIHAAYPFFNTAGLIGLNVVNYDKILQLRYVILPDDITEKAVLAGFKTEPNGNYSFSATAGVGLVSREASYYSSKSPIDEFGFAMQLAAIFPINRYLGGGVALHVNFKSGEAITALSFSAHLGKLY